TMTFSDVDLTDKHTVVAAFVPTDEETPLGKMTADLTSDTTVGVGGVITWAFNVDNAAVQFLAAGQSVTEIYSVTVTDSHGGKHSQNVSVTITGTNDAPVISTAPVVAGVTEATDPETTALTEE